MKKSLFLVLFSFAILIASCSSEPTPTIEETVDAVVPSETTQAAYPYPAPQQSFQQTPYPEPQDSAQSGATTTPEPTYTAAPNTGTAIGRVLLRGEPVAEYTFYLAEVIMNEQGEASVASLNRIDSPRTNTNDEGNFTFRNVPPGTYGLVLDVVRDAYLLHYPDEDAQIVVTVAAGQELDIGVLDYDDLPIP
ncbi:MAG: hypothetical protein PVG14_12350 [Anaerolineales bacterium]